MNKIATSSKNCICAKEVKKSLEPVIKPIVTVLTILNVDKYCIKKILIDLTVVDNFCIFLIPESIISVFIEYSITNNSRRCVC